MYAVVRTGGKQYRVEEGRAVRVERLAGEVGDVIELGDVLLMDVGSGLNVGAPTIDGARVLGTIAEQGRSKKIVVFRYKAKTRYRKKTGHRQHFTKVIIDDILLPGADPKPKVERERPPAEDEAKPKGKRRKTAAEAVAATEAAAPATLEADAAEAAPTKPKRGRKSAE